MGSMKSSSNALSSHLRRLLVTGDCNVDTLEGTHQGASSLAKPTLPLSLSTQGALSPAKHASHMPLSMSTRTATTSSSAMFLHKKTNRKNVGCSRSLESDLLRNTQNSFGASRWFGLRPFACVKHFYDWTSKAVPIPQHKRNTKNSEDNKHTRLNSKPCRTGCHLQLDSQSKLCITYTWFRAIQQRMCNVWFMIRKGSGRQACNCYLLPNSI